MWGVLFFVVSSGCGGGYARARAYVRAHVHARARAQVLRVCSFRSRVCQYDDFTAWNKCKLIALCFGFFAWCGLFSLFLSFGRVLRDTLHYDTHTRTHVKHGALWRHTVYKMSRDPEFDQSRDPEIDQSRYPEFYQSRDLYFGRILDLYFGGRGRHHHTYIIKSLD